MQLTILSKANGFNSSVPELGVSAIDDPAALLKILMINLVKKKEKEKQKTPQFPYPHQCTTNNVCAAQQTQYCHTADDTQSKSTFAKKRPTTCIQ